MSKMRLYCFPYAGGSAAVFNKWRTYLNRKIELVPVELAGRGIRFREAFYGSMFEAVNDLYSRLSPTLTQGPYAFFGHSMGSLLVYELCHKIMAENRIGPVHIFLSGKSPPHLKKETKLLHTLPIEKFKEELYEIGGTPREVLENQELMDIFIPILKADYQIYETYEFTPRDTKLKAGITVFNGISDNIGYEAMLEWGEYTSGSSEIYQFEGGHFFIHQHTVEIVKIINETLGRYCPALAN